MTAGRRALDAEVAEKVMGWASKKKVIPPHDCYLAGCIGPGCGAAHERVVWTEPPRYSSNPAACALVKAKLREKGIAFSVTWDWSRRDGKDQFLGTNASACSKDDRYFDVEGLPTEEEAVCRLALALHAAGVLP